MSKRPPSIARSARLGLAVGALLLAALAHAQTQAVPAAAAPAATAPSLTPLILGMLLVLALIPAAVWVLRRAGLAQAGSAGGLRVVAQLALGPRERLVVIEAGDRRWLLGVSAAGITRLGTLPPGNDAASGLGAAPPASGGAFADIIRRLGSPR